MADVEAQYANFGPLDDAKKQADTFMRKTKKGGVSIVRKGRRLAGKAKSVVVGDTWGGTAARLGGAGALAGAIVARKPIGSAAQRAGLMTLGAARMAVGSASRAGRGAIASVRRTASNAIARGEGIAKRAAKSAPIPPPTYISID